MRRSCTFGDLHDLFSVDGEGVRLDLVENLGRQIVHELHEGRHREIPIDVGDVLGLLVLLGRGSDERRRKQALASSRQSHASAGLRMEGATCTHDNLSVAWNVQEQVRILITRIHS